MPFQISTIKPFQEEKCKYHLQRAKYDLNLSLSLSHILSLFKALYILHLTKKNFLQIRILKLTRPRQKNDCQPLILILLLSI